MRGVVRPYPARLSCGGFLLQNDKLRRGPAQGSSHGEVRDDKTVPLPDLFGDGAQAGALGGEPVHGEDGVLLLGDRLQTRRAASTELAISEGHGAADMAACG